VAQHYLDNIVHIVVLGVVLVLIGFAVSYAPWLVNWFGRLPGDIRIQNEKSFVFIPIVSMLIVSIILTLIINLFFRK
jgi:fructose-specific phosphotransferase system IIC component